MATFIQKLKLLKGLCNGGLAYAGPFYVSIDITRRCNLQCPGCRYHTSGLKMPSPGDQSIPDISFDSVEKLCIELKKMGTHSVILLGEGEPFFHPRLLDIVSIAKKYKLHVTLLSNGTLLTETNIGSLIDFRLDILKVSLWASSLEEYIKIYPGSDPGNFNKIIDSLKLLSQIKVKRGSKFPAVTLHQPITLYNFQNIDTMLQLANSTGCSVLSFAPFKTRRGKMTSSALSQDQEHNVRLFLRGMRKECKSLSLGHNIDQILLRYRIGENVWEKLPCFIAWLHAHIKVDGTVFACNPCDTVLGNLNDKSFSEIWNDAPFRRFRGNTLTIKGLTDMTKHCDCGFCCHLEDNVRVHSLFKWLPFAVIGRMKE